MRWKVNSVLSSTEAKLGERGWDKGREGCNRVGEGSDK